VIIDQAVYRDGRRQPSSDLAADAVLLQEEGAGFLWIGLKNPTDEEFAHVSEVLDLHPLAVEDAIRGRQRVKLETYGTTRFAALKTLHYVEDTSDIETGEILMFVGQRFVVTVRHGEGAPLGRVRERLEREPDRLAAEGTGAVFHAVLDAIVDTYLEIDMEVSHDVSEIEEDVFGGPNHTHSATIYRLKREILEFRRAALPLVHPVQRLQESDLVPSAELRLRFRDVADHLMRVVDHIETYDRLLTDILSTHLAQISVRQNSDMRKISAWVAIAAVPTMVAGIYGMNFTHMPELNWTFGYPLVLAVVAVVCVSLYRAFRRNGWL
jgi:magnesium transporter